VPSSNISASLLVISWFECDGQTGKGNCLDRLASSEELARLRQKIAWYLAQAEEYKSGRPEAGTENGIVAAMRCAEMAAKYRGWAQDLAILVEAHTELDERQTQGESG
jgi:hypothetical protein